MVSGCSGFQWPRPAHEEKLRLTEPRTPPALHWRLTNSSRQRPQPTLPPGGHGSVAGVSISGATRWRVRRACRLPRRCTGASRAVSRAAWQPALPRLAAGAPAMSVPADWGATGSMRVRRAARVAWQPSRPTRPRSRQSWRHHGRPPTRHPAATCTRQYRRDPTKPRAALWSGPTRRAIRPLCRAAATPLCSRPPRCPHRWARVAPGLY